MDFATPSIAQLRWAVQRFRAHGFARRVAVCYNRPSLYRSGNHGETAKIWLREGMATVGVLGDQPFGGVEHGVGLCVDRGNPPTTSATHTRLRFQYEYAHTHCREYDAHPAAGATAANADGNASNMRLRVRCTRQTR